MSKFQVGDIVKGTKSHKYTITDEYMTKGKVISVSEVGSFEVLVLEHVKSYNEGQTFAGLDSAYFELVKPKTSIKGVEVVAKEEAQIITINEKLVIAVPTINGFGISSVIDGEEFVEEIGKSLAFYRHQTGGMK